MKLKATIGTLILTLLCALKAEAQIGDQRHELSVGFGGGINMNSASFSPSIKQKNLMGIHGGFTARYISEKYFAVPR